MGDEGDGAKNQRERNLLASARVSPIVPLRCMVLAMSFLVGFLILAGLPRSDLRLGDWEAAALAGVFREGEAERDLRAGEAEAPAPEALLVGDRDREEERVVAAASDFLVPFAAAFPLTVLGALALGFAAAVALGLAEAFVLGLTVLGFAAALVLGFVPALALGFGLMTSAVILAACFAAARFSSTPFPLFPASLFSRWMKLAPSLATALSVVRLGFLATFFAGSAAASPASTFFLGAMLWMWLWLWMCLGVVLWL